MVDISLTRQDRADAKRLRLRVRRYIHHHRNDLSVDPFEIATAIMQELDLQDSYVAAHLQVRQVSRELLRHEFDMLGENDNDNEEETGSTGHSASALGVAVRLRPESFRQPEIPNLLQDRYPQADGSGYIKREEMADTDWRYNLNGLAKDIAGKQAHYDALRSWGEAKGWTVETQEAKDGHSIS